MLERWNSLSLANVVPGDELLVSQIEDEAVLVLIGAVMQLTVVASVHDNGHIVFRKPDLNADNFVNMFQKVT